MPIKKSRVRVEEVPHQKKIFDKGVRMVNNNAVF